MPVNMFLNKTSRLLRVSARQPATSAYPLRFLHFLCDKNRRSFVLQEDSFEMMRCFVPQQDNSTQSFSQTLLTLSAIFSLPALCLCG